MIWEDTFYAVKDITGTDNGFNAVVQVHTDHPIFEGHFPEHPVVPGVCTLAMIKKTVSLYLKRDVMFPKVKESKFVSAIVPQENLLLNISVAFKNETSIVATVTSNDIVALKLKATIN